MFEKIKRFYDMKLYTREQIAAFVEKGKLAAEQYREITGEDYPEAAE